jgi:precorrin-2 dehydrogenase/sirohydrochlorin ferrochelatase
MLYPVMLDLKGKKSVVVGGGKVALRKILELIKCCNNITVISPKLCNELKAFKDRDEIRWVESPYEKKHIEGAFLCFACTDKTYVNAKVLEDCKSMGILVNMADGMADGDFIVPAVRREADITISTSCNNNPVASRYLADYLKSCITPWLVGYISMTGILRAICKEHVVDVNARQDYIRKLYSSEFIELAKIDLGRAYAKAEERLKRLIEKGV